MRVPAGFGLLARLAFGVSKPRQTILGTELAGDVESVGKDVRKFKAGDPVYAFPGSKMGCHAEYRCMPEGGAVVAKPANLTYEEAAALCFAGTTVLDFFRRGGLKSGERILIHGASGGVGTAAVQIASHMEAEVTAVCSTANLEMVRALGAQHVIDYTRDDFTQNGETYDVIVDTVGTAPFSRTRGSLSERGRQLQVLSSLGGLLKVPFVAMTSTKRIIDGPAAERVEDARTLGVLAERGVFKPVIDRRYPFDQIVEAHRYVDTGHKKGNVVITMTAGD